MKTDLTEVQPGLFTVDGPMPCSPRQITIRPWAMPSTLDRFETEEAAARLLHFSQQLDQWVGVSWSRLVEMLKADLADEQRLLEAQRRNSDRERFYEDTLWSYRVRCVLTLGLYALLIPKPTLYQEALPDVDLPVSGLFLWGPRHIGDGLADLKQRGLLTVKEVSQDLVIFFPTPALIERIMQKQGLATT